MRSSTGTGRVSVGVADTRCTPATKVSRTPVIYLGSHAGNSLEPLGVGLPSCRKITRRFTRHGFSVVSVNVLALWANDTSQTLIAAALTDHRTNLGGTNDPPFIIAGSGGSDCAFRYAMDNPVSGMLVYLPVWNNAEIIDENISGNAASVLAAHGGSLPPAGDLHARALAGELADVAPNVYYAGDDPYAGEIAPFAAACPLGTFTNTGNDGHSDTVVADLVADIEAVMTFVEAHA